MGVVGPTVAPGDTPGVEPDRLVVAGGTSDAEGAMGGGSSIEELKKSEVMGGLGPLKKSSTVELCGSPMRIDRAPRSSGCAALGGDGAVLVEFASYWGDAAGGSLRGFVADFEPVWADLACSFPLDESSESAVWMACSMANLREASLAYSVLAMIASASGR